MKLQTLAIDLCVLLACVNKPSTGSVPPKLLGAACPWQVRPKQLQRMDIFQAEEPGIGKEISVPLWAVVLSGQIFFVKLFWLSLLSCPSCEYEEL